MNKEDYVSLECAKLLKEKGYDDECELAYETDKEPAKLVVHCMPNHRLSNTDYACPTFYEAQKWLREIHNIDVLPVIREESTIKDYCCNVYKNAKVVRCKVAYGEDFYECMNEGLVEALNLI